MPPDAQQSSQNCRVGPMQHVRGSSNKISEGAITAHIAHINKSCTSHCCFRAIGNYQHTWHLWLMGCYRYIPHIQTSHCRHTQKTTADVCPSAAHLVIHLIAQSAFFLTQSTVWMAWNSLSFSTGSFTYVSSSRLYISVMYRAWRAAQQVM